MKNLFSISTFFVFTILLSVSAKASSAIKYELTIYNATQMPLSPLVAYTIEGNESAAPIGSQPNTGFVQLCQAGNNTTRLNELKADRSVKFTTKTSAPILPGESQVIELEVANPNQQSIHFETMYGKTKDVCGVGSINSHSLVALRQHVTTEVIQKDNALLTGAFLSPVIPAGMSYPHDEFCTESMNAVSCLRELSLPATDNKRIKFFSGYLPSVINLLEMKYGAADLQTLLFLPSGAIQYKLKLKH
ncbi:MAG: hypothetical protein ABL927_01335 [Bdellovibrionales bacterium]